MSAALEHIHSRSRQENLTARDFMLNRAVEVDLDAGCSDYEIPPAGP